MGDRTDLPRTPGQRGQFDSPAFEAAAVQSRFIDLTGQRFGTLTVLAYIAKSYWLCRCDCGTEKRAYSGNLKAGRTRSCGCRRTPTTSAEVRFWRKVDRTREGCWEWQAARLHRGYGVFNINAAGDGSDRSRMAHRYSYELHNGAIPEGMFVMHTCDNPPCVRPDHLRLGTHDDNMRDMKLKGRARTDVHKVTDCEVEEIRLMASEGIRLADIAEKYDIDRGYAFSIATGRRR